MKMRMAVRALCGLVAVSLCAGMLAERPVTRYAASKGGQQVRRVQDAGVPKADGGKSAAKGEAGKSKRKTAGNGGGKASGKTTAPSGSRRHRRRAVEVDDPVEVRRARAEKPLARGTVPLQAQRKAPPAMEPAARGGHAIVASVKTHALVTPAAPAPPVALRVDGFGAEGAVLVQGPAAKGHGVPVADPDDLVLRGEAVLPEVQTKVLAEPAVAATGAASARRPELLRPATRVELAEEAVTPIVLPGLYRHGRLVMPQPLKGSREVLVHQNTMADAEGLDRIADDEQLDEMRAAHLLVDLQGSASLRVNPGLSADRRCARPWAVRFATDMGRAFAAKFRQPLQVNSAVRTVSYQLQLQRVNGNAAAVDGEGASPHLTGQALDFGKRGMSRTQLAWMRAYLLPLMRAGKIDVEEEFQQACFHVSVYRSYMPAAKKKPRTMVAQLHRAPMMGR